MKKILLVAMAAAAMVSCSQNEEIENIGQKAKIKLGAIVNTTTKAIVTDNTNFNTFSVVGYITDASMSTETSLGTAFIPVTKIDKSGETWTAKELDYYWPYNKQVQFFATSPAQTLTVAAGYPTFDYTVKSTSATQEDLVVAKMIDQTKETAGANGVVLPFTHALTQVNFSVKGADNYTYKVSSITIEGLKNKGTYSLETGKWSSFVNDEAVQSVYEYPLSANPIAVTSTTDAPVGATNAALMLLPQDMPSTAGTALVKVSYQVYSGETPISELISATADLNGTTNWIPGTKIRYTITLANDGTKIKLGIPSVAGWADSETPENLPKQN